MGRTLVYPKTHDNTVHRMNDRGTYDLHEIHSIVNATPVLHVSFNSTSLEKPFPSILPMIGVMGSYSHPSADLGEPLDCYLHGYISAELMKQARSLPEKGLPLTIAATRMDGMVLSLTPNSHSYNYRSAILFGHGKLVEDVDEKVWAMKLVTDSVIPGRWEETRTPPDGTEMSSTAILKVQIVSGSGKIRRGSPKDDKKDTDREDVTNQVWTGVIPMWETAGDPVPGGSGRVKEVPAHIASFCEQTKRSNEAYAQSAALS